MNDRGGNGAGCFDVEELADTTELTNVKVAGAGKCSYLVGDREMFIKDEAEIASRVGGKFCNLASCCLSPLRRNSVLEEWRVTRVAVIQEEIYCKAFWK